MDQSSLTHYGILGMKWGVRRYQNADGSLTSAGKKRYSKQYEEEIGKAHEDYKKSYEKMYVDAWNKTADIVNNSGVDSSQFEKYAEEVFTKQLNKSIYDFYKNNEHVQKGQALAAKYDMTSWDELAKTRTSIIEELRKAVEEDDD